MSFGADPILAAAFWTGTGALLLTLLLGLQIVRLRISLRARERRQARTLARWRPLLNAAIVGDSPAQLPKLLASERLHFIKLWVHLQSSLRGEAGAALNTIACRLGLDNEARAMLGRRARTERLLAALMLGHLGDRQAWPALLRLAGLDDPTLSLTALWALVRIDPQAAAEYLTPLFIERDDWAMSHVAGILQQAGTPVAAVLAGMLPRLDARRLPRALRIAEALRVELPAAALAAALASDAVPVTLAALRIVNTPLLQQAVRGLLAHEDWQVRVQAAKALGRIGERADTARLVALLADREWWVRYRAAQALAELPWLRRAELDDLRASLDDRFAADMLAQVMAEQDAAAAQRNADAQAEAA
ncbi:HEAT repeat domain-containing protein [Massilia sp. LXY-6]|uniref:HEAT repeat domain-containing protein n=1 Tax=Massilia sp. LXY-6 TaxID=3379823 RepID=UPI003EDFF70E